MYKPCAISVRSCFQWEYFPYYLHQLDRVAGAVHFEDDRPGRPGVASTDECETARISDSQTGTGTGGAPSKPPALMSIFAYLEIVCRLM